MMDKLSQWLTVLLLAGILASLLLDRPSAACLDARDHAQTVAKAAASIIASADRNYDADVYTTAQNINQQILLADENIYKMAQLTAGLELARVNVETACK